MNMCPTINISPCNIIGDKDNISLKMNPQMVEDVKEMYGIDLENKKLLMHLKKFGSIKIASSATRSLLNNCQTEAKLVREDEEELKEAKVELKETGGYYYPCSYELVERWANSIENYIYDVIHKMNSNETKQVLLKEALNLINLLSFAFKDSKETFNNLEFRIKA